MKFTFIRKLEEQKALHLLSELFKKLTKSAELHTICEKFYRDVIKIQLRMRNMVCFNTARTDFLTEYWQSEVTTYKFALASSKQKKHKVLLK